MTHTEEITPNDTIIAIWKKRGETPLEALTRLRAHKPEYSKEILSYAGRLDPMAEGVLPILVGVEANKNRNLYTGLDKIYSVEILFGISTDTYDLLGIPQSSCIPDKTFNYRDAELSSTSFIGTRIQQYPPFSSKTIGGVPMHVLARAGKLIGLDIPSQEVAISDIRINGWRQVSSQSLLEEIEKLPEIITGDFRQKEIVDAWKTLLTKTPDTLFPLLSLTVSCSSGTYMRTLAHEIGIALDTPALAYTIVRSNVGNMRRDDCVI